MARLERWFIDKYKLPPSSPTFQNRSIADWNLEYLTDLAMRLREIDDEIDASVGSDRMALVRTKGQLRIALGIAPKTVQKEEDDHDALIAKWEAQLAAGEIPDLNER